MNRNPQITQISQILMMLLLLALGVVTSGWALDLGGYCENDLSFTFADTGFFGNNAMVRVEAGAGNDEYALEAHAILKASLQPLDPFSALRPESKMAQITAVLMAGMSSQADTAMAELMANMDPALLASLAGMDSVIAARLQGLEGMDGLLRYFSYSSYYPGQSVVLDRALVKVFFKKLDLYVGRQQIAWGTGYAFNPTDLWNAKNPLDPKAPKAGANAVRAEIPLGGLSNLNFVSLPGADLKHSPTGLRIKSNIKGFDASVSATYFMNADRELFGLPKKLIGGLDLAGQIGEVGVWTETAFTNRKYESTKYSDFDSAYIQLDVGLDYTFEGGIYVLAEYYHNGLGKDDPAQYDPGSFFNLMAGDMAGLAQNYVMLGVRKNFADKVDFNLFSMVNADDQSTVIIPTADYYFSDEVSIQLGGSVPMGDEKETELGSSYPTASAKVTAYF